MTIENSNMGEPPIFSCKAHVFHIDPKTKRSWLPASTTAVSVSFFYDSTRQLYRIISVEGTKAVINSTITPNMVFTKTSQKFGQWSDMRANTVYGLGFSSEHELNKFIEKFQDVKEATRSVKTNGTTSQMPQSMGQGIQLPIPPAIIPQSNQAPGVPMGSVTVSGAGLVNTGPTPAPPQGHGGSASASPLTSRAKHETMPPPPMLDMNSVSSGVVSSSGESPKHSVKIQQQSISIDKNVDSQAQLKYENDRLKLALAQSSANAKKWEVELNSLKNTNARLTAALQESTANVEEWKKQLQTYKDENSRMKSRVLELEAGSSIRDVDEATQEIASLRIRTENLSGELEVKDHELDELKTQMQKIRSEQDKAQMLSDEKEQLRLEISRCQSQLEVALATQESQRGVVESVNLQLGGRIKDLLALHHELNHLLTT